MTGNGLNKDPQLSAKEYNTWLAEIKASIAKAQIKVAHAANSELIFFYWELGKAISKKFEEAAWGNKVIERLAVDLKEEFPNLSGFSRRNLYYIKKFYQFFSCSTSTNEIVPQAGAQLLHANIQKYKWMLKYACFAIIVE